MVEKQASSEIAPDEREIAMKIANEILDTPYNDPDGDMCILSRQFLRAIEREATSDETGECGGCLCAEVGFPTICNRWTDWAREAERIRGKE